MPQWVEAALDQIQMQQTAHAGNLQWNVIRCSELKSMDITEAKSDLRAA